ncbi:Pre-mRNA-splicing factor CWC2 [Mycena venus]|uniref:Pre-mRNA-splicing factor CWC2 n=1 Tax=Mycena venus TaxID=2733690 RepID=A0A8H6XAJ2_9AGAR|nr:Pre-mRNA-splicing factor CWC2 [Mycena venus]
MSETAEVQAQTVAVAAPKKQKKLKPARKQVKPGDVVKTEAPQTGKEYNIWYNKWAGGDREDSYSKGQVSLSTGIKQRTVELHGCAGIVFDHTRVSWRRAAVDFSCFGRWARRHAHCFSGFASEVVALARLDWIVLGKSGYAKSQEKPDPWLLPEWLSSDVKNNHLRALLLLSCSTVQRVRVVTDLYLTAKSSPKPVVTSSATLASPAQTSLVSSTPVSTLRADAVPTAGSANTCICSPDPNDQLPDSSKDCFARDKFSDYRDDMGGVGSFNRQNRTLYIGRIKETGNGLETEEVVMRHFKEWGQIERDNSETGWAVKVLQYRSVAFVTYVSELHAQFAKEAMACQSLDNDEILNVRWATEDPNPVQKVAEKRRLVDMGQEVIKAKIDPRIVDAMRTIRALEDGDVLDEDGYIVDGDEEEDEVGDDGTGEPGSKRRRLEAPPPSAATGEDEPPQPKGLLSADTLEGLKYFAEIRKRNGGAPAAPPPRAAAAPAPLKEGLGLADYGSDDED